MREQIKYVGQKSRRAYGSQLQEGGPSLQAWWSHSNLAVRFLTNKLEKGLRWVQPAIFIMCKKHLWLWVVVFVTGDS